MKPTTLKTIALLGAACGLLAGPASAATVAYIVRAVTPGTFAHPAATVEDMYRPERHARTAAEPESAPAVEALVGLPVAGLSVDRKRARLGGGPIGPLKAAENRDEATALIGNLRRCGEWHGKAQHQQSQYPSHASPFKGGPAQDAAGEVVQTGTPREVCAAPASAFVAELVGTFTLVFVGAGAIILDAHTKGGVALLGIAVAHGLALGVAVTITAPTSGGHLNPAVTAAMLATRRIAAGKAGGYIVSQLVGAAVAGAQPGREAPGTWAFRKPISVPALTAPAFVEIRLDGDVVREAAMRARAKTFAIPTVAANEVLYHSRARRPLQDVLTCIRHGVTLATAGRKIRGNDEHDLRAPHAFGKLFHDDAASVARTLDVAARCTFSRVSVPA